MDFNNFVRKAIEDDSRNVFSQYSGDLTGIPEPLKTLYKESNPVDVEVNFIRFYAAEELNGLQNEYSYLNAQFIFATCNGDPIFFHEGKIYTCPHGVDKPEWELIGENVETFFDSIV